MAVGLSRTTIVGSVAAADTRVRFAAATGFTSGLLAYINREAMVLQRPIEPGASTVWQVLRGQAGTAAAAHAANDQVFVGRPGYFYSTPVQGWSSQDGEVALPHINVLTGDSFMIGANGNWQKGEDDGVPAQLALTSGTLAVFSSNGALAIQNGAVEVNSASARAMTLAAPALADEGTVITVFGSGGGAHTVTPAGGFAGTATVATFGAGGGTLILQVVNGKFRPLSSVGVTFT